MTTTIAFVLKSATEQLDATSETARLDAEVLLAHTLQMSRSSLHAWPERELTQAEQEQFAQLVKRRSQKEPIAYITEHREFWSLDLMVTPATLIPRPETELLVELILKKLSGDVRTVADLGTGSGAIALAIASERPTWSVHATDCMLSALEVAKQNVERLGLTNVIFHQGSWCAALPAIEFDAILSNPPYIAENDACVTEEVRQFEPLSALFSGQDGLKDTREIVREAKNRLKTGGYIVLEHGYQQGVAIRELLEQFGYTEIILYQDLAGLDRVTVGRKPLV